MESTRKKEAEVKKETADQLESFRRQQEEADRRLLNIEADNAVENEADQLDSKKREEAWTVNKGKRKRDKKQDPKGFKLRRTSSTLEEDPSLSTAEGTSHEKSLKSVDTADSRTPTLKDSVPGPDASEVPAQAITGLGLVGYSSEEDT